MHQLDTIDDPTQTGPESDVATGMRVVVLWHRDPSRIGRRAWVPWQAGDLLEISRVEPVLDDGQPLADPRISRSPLQFVATPAGVECWPTRDGMRFDVDGLAGTPGMCITTPKLVAGVRLGVGRGALLHLQIGPRPRVGLSGTLLGASDALERVADAIKHAATSRDAVLIQGESGTGKELVARAIHASSPREGRAFVAVNMAAISETMAASQLFGHVRGAFTGADQATSGLFGAAHGGTLFLDEIGACSLEVQAQLLRALESGEVQVVGGASRRVDVRVLAATDADLEDGYANGDFRAPLYHRLAQRTIQIPPLRTRTADIPVQAVHFLREGFAERGREWPEDDDESPPWLGREVIEALLDWVWPGNTRELRAVTRRMLDERADASACVPPRFRAVGPASRAPTSTDATADLRDALARCGHRLGATAELLGIGRNTLKRWMDEEGIRRPTDIPAAEIRTIIARTGTVTLAARELGVSEHGLKLRLADGKP